jgi:hypothetical protein
LSAFETWVHVNPYILKQGRITHYIPKNLKQEDAEELKSKLEDKDPNVERLKGISDDKREESL